MDLDEDEAIAAIKASEASQLCEDPPSPGESATGENDNEFDPLWELEQQQERGGGDGMPVIALPMQAVDVVVLSGGHLLLPTTPADVVLKAGRGWDPFLRQLWSAGRL